jgi:MraZ protein
MENKTEHFFNGNIDVALDEKNRFVLPAKWRKTPELSGQSFFITRGWYSSLEIYPAQEWMKFLDKLSSLNQFDPDYLALEMLIHQYLHEVTLDQNFRIMFQPHHLAFLNLSGKSVRLIGRGNKIMVIDPPHMEDLWSNVGKMRAAPQPDSYEELMTSLLGTKKSES